MNFSAEGGWRKRARPLAYAIFGFLVIVGVAGFFRLREPRADGRSLSAWLNDLGPGYPHWSDEKTPWIQERIGMLSNRPSSRVIWFESGFNDANLQKEMAVRIALKKMGRRAIPHLQDRVLLSHSPSRFQGLLLRILPVWYGNRLQVNDSEISRRRYQGVFALSVLNGEAASLIAVLEESLLQRPRLEISQALEFSYPASIPAALNILEKGGVDAQTQVLEILKNWHDDDPRILVAIQNTFTNVEPMIRQRGSYVLGAIAAESASGIESIRGGLRHPDTLVRRFNAFCAGLAGTNAITLVPELTTAKTDADRVTARFAVTALRMLHSREAEGQEPK
jgi:hypothetical protein